MAKQNGNGNGNNLPAVVPELGDSFDVTKYVRKATAADIGGMKAAGYEARKVYVMQAGDTIEGVFRGPGAPVEVTDKISGEVRPVPTVDIDVGDGVVLGILASSQVERELKGYQEGRKVRVIHLGQKRVGARMINEFLVGKESTPPVKAAP